MPENPFPYEPFPDETAVTPVPPPPMPTPPVVEEEVVEIPLDISPDTLAPEARFIECPNCHQYRRKFLIVNGKCDSCRTRDAIPVNEGGRKIAEIRQRRLVLMQRTDWSQLSDIPLATQTQYRVWRQQLRDITTLPTLAAAWAELNRIEAEITLAEKPPA